MKKIYKQTILILAGFTFSVSTINAQLYDNGPLINSPGAGSGGANVSNLHSGLTTFGFGHALSTLFRVGDDFVVPAPGWNIDSIVFYAYQTGSTTTSTINHLNVAIWDGQPGAGGNIIWGDTTTNRLAGSYWSGIYRTTDVDLLNTQRPIMADRANTAGCSLAPGTYWVTWQTGGTLASGPWAPPITVTGVTVTGNAVQFDPTAQLWNPANDLGLVTQQGFPFKIYGTTQSAGTSCIDTALFAGLSVAIPENDPLGVTDNQVTSTISGTTLGVDVNLTKVCFKISHTWVGDLIVSLASPGGTPITLLDRPGVPASTFGCSGDDLDMCIVLGTGNEAESVCANAPAISGDFTAANGSDLSSINAGGGSPNGTWGLTVSDNAGGDTGTLTEWSLYFNSGPDPAWNGPDTICGTSGSLNLDTYVTGTPGGTWSGTGVTGSTFNPTGLSGNISITYTVSAGSCTNTETHIINVVPAVPVCGFTYNTVNTTVNFTNTSTGALTYQWNFGDGNSSALQNPSNTYASNGTYTVTLTVGNICGSTSCSQQVTISGCPDIIVDGSFEAGSPSAAWTEFSSNFGTPLCTQAGCGLGGGTGPNTGTWWAWFGGIAAFEEGSLSQQITIPSNSTANLYFFLEVPVACDSPNDFMKVAVASDTVYTVDGSSPLCANPTYSLQTVNLDVYADGTPRLLNFFSRIYGTNATVTNYFVDDISILACPVGINEQSIAQYISVQPNPTSVAVNLSLSGIKKDVRIQIMTLQGQAMYSKQIEKRSDQFNEKIDVSKWAKGVYMITISTDEKVITEKIVIQ